MPLDPWIIEEIKKREEEKKRREGENRPTVPADDPREIPERRDDDGRGPGYEMPSPGDPKRDERPAQKEETPQRGVTIIDIGGGSEDESGAIEIAKIPASVPEDEAEKRPE